MVNTRQGTRSLAAKSKLLGGINVDAGNGKFEKTILPAPKDSKPGSACITHAKRDTIDERHAPHRAQRTRREIAAGNGPGSKVRGENVIASPPKRPIVKNAQCVANNEVVKAPPECTIWKPIKELMELVFHQKTIANFEGDRKALLKLNAENIKQGYRWLEKLESLIHDKKKTCDDPEIQFYYDMYRSVIPHQLSGEGRLSNENAFNKELRLLKDAAEAMKVNLQSKGTVHFLDRKFQDLRLNEMTLLAKGVEFEYLKSYLNVSRCATDQLTYEVKTIFRIERQGESERFQTYMKTLDNPLRRLLWHGSSVKEYGRILSEGLETVSDSVGKGIYLYEMSSQAAGYCDYTNYEGQALLLLCEAALGHPIEKVTKASDRAGINATMDSTCCQGKRAFKRFKAGSAVHKNFEGVKLIDINFAPKPTNAPGASLDYHSFICRKVDQVKLRYLLHVKISK